VGHHCDVWSKVGALSEHSKAGGVQWYAGADPRASVALKTIEE